MNNKKEENNLEPTEQEITEILEDVPEKSKKIIEEMMISSIQMRSESPETIAAHNITPEHISQFLSSTDKEIENNYKDKRQERWFIFAIILSVLIFTLAIIKMLKGTPEIMEKVLYTIGGFVTGALGGYGFGKSKNSD